MSAPSTPTVSDPFPPPRENATFESLRFKRVVEFRIVAPVGIRLLMSMTLNEIKLLKSGKGAFYRALNPDRRLASIAERFDFIRRSSYAALDHLHPATSTHRAEISPQGI